MTGVQTCALPIYNQQDDDTIDIDEVKSFEEYEDLEVYLNSKGLAIIPTEFLQDLMNVMESHVIKETGVTKEELQVLIKRLEDLIGEDGMSEMSLEGIIGWVKTLSADNKD